MTTTASWSCRTDGLSFDEPSTAEAELAEVRLTYEPLAYELGRRLLFELPPWLPDADAMDDWQSSPWDTLPRSDGAPRHAT